MSLYFLRFLNEVSQSLTVTHKFKWLTAIDRLDVASHSRQMSLLNQFDFINISSTPELLIPLHYNRKYKLFPCYLCYVNIYKRINANFLFPCYPFYTSFFSRISKPFLLPEEKRFVCFWITNRFKGLCNSIDI